MIFALSDIRKTVHDAFAVDNAATVRVATTATLVQGADEFKLRARQNIAAAGFSKKWQNALRVKKYPEKEAEDGAIWGYHKIPYSGVFEEGANITPKARKFLWIPLPTAPRTGRGKLTPRQLIQRGVKLFPFRSSKGKPLLGANVRQSNKGGSKFLTLSKLRRGVAGKRGRVSGVALFVGVRQVTLRRRFRIGDIAQVVAKALPQIYDANVKRAGG